MFERHETLVPELAEKLAHLGESLRVKAVESPGPLATLGDESRVAEDAEMLRYRRAGCVEVLGDLAGRELAMMDETEYLDAIRLGQSLEFLEQHGHNVSDDLRKKQVTFVKGSNHRRGRHLTIGGA